MAASPELSFILCHSDDETSDELSSFIPIFKKLLSDPTIKNSVFSAASAAKEEVKAEAASSLTHHKVPAIDWKETTLRHVITADIPGLKKEQVKVEVEEDGHVLSISGVRKKEHVGDVVKTYHAERSSGKFWRRFHVPENAKMEEIKAVMEHGVLTITLPKVEAPKKLVKAVQITAP